MNSLRMRYVVLVICLAVGLLTTSPAQAQLGVAGGLNFDRIGDLDAGNRQATFDNATGFHVGVFYDASFGPLAVRPGVFYMDVGKFDVGGEDDFTPEVSSFDMSLIEVPIDARFQLLALPIVKPYATAGPVFRFANADDDEFGDSLNNFSVAANIGLGAEVSLPGVGLRLFPELRYSFGVTRMVDNFEFLGGEFTTEESNLNTFMLRLGVGL